MLRIRLLMIRVNLHGGNRLPTCESLALRLHLVDLLGHLAAALDLQNDDVHSILEELVYHGLGSATVGHGKGVYGPEDVALLEPNGVEKVLLALNPDHIPCDLITLIPDRFHGVENRDHPVRFIE